jgi:hypothetical protein
LGNELSIVALALLLSGVALALGHQSLAVLAITGPGLIGVAPKTSKPLIGWTIGGELAFPSSAPG